MVIARNSGLAVHHVTVHDLGGKLIVTIDLEVDGAMALMPRTTSPTLERSIRDEFGEDVEVDTHIEPLEPELPHGTDASSERVAAIKSALRDLPPTAPSMTSIMCGCATPTPAKSLTFIAAQHPR